MSRGYEAAYAFILQLARWRVGWFCSLMGIKNAEATMLSAVAPAGSVIGHRKGNKFSGSARRVASFFMIFRRQSSLELKFPLALSA